MGASPHTNSGAIEWQNYAGARASVGRFGGVLIAASGQRGAKRCAPEAHAAQPQRGQGRTMFALRGGFSETSISLLLLLLQHRRQRAFGRALSSRARERARDLRDFFSSWCATLSRLV
ncbi:unnamed protein product [Lampetra planeri]